MSRESEGSPRRVHATTILGIVGRGRAAIGGDGQVTFDDTIMKHSSTKIRRLYDGTVLAGFAGAAADALTLFERFEEKLESYKGQLQRAVVELAKDWRTDRFLRRLEALLICMDAEKAFVISGNGDIIEPDDGIVAIGSGGSYALAAARAFMIEDPGRDLKQTVASALQIASEICPYTNEQITIMTLPDEETK
jgi:ATP-dependent HslUV protease subunit HslV